MKWWYADEEERTMEFDKSKVFTALNADELKPGDKVIVADTLSVLKQRVRVQEGKDIVVLQKINGEDWGRRFGFSMSDYALAYLVERPESCATCAHNLYCFDVKNQSSYHRNICKCTEWERPEVQKKYKAEEKMKDWIFTSEGQLPEKKELNVSDRVVVAVEGFPYVSVGYYDYEAESWFIDGAEYPAAVYAWLDCKPPKVEA